MPGSSEKKVPLTVLGSRQRRGGGGVISASVVLHRQIATHMGEGGGVDGILKEAAVDRPSPRP